MFYHAKNGRIQGTDYIRFGSGSRVLVMLPGLGDGLQTVKGMALPMAWTYRMFAEDFTVYLFSRKRELPEGYTTRNMARDLAEAMNGLGIRQADILGVSMGGMIAQWLAIDYPEKVNKLILAVTASQPNPILEGAVRTWMDLARQGDHGAFMDSNVRMIYSDAYYRQNRFLIPLMGKLTKPRSYGRFLIQAEACLQHDAFRELSEIRHQTLIIGGEQDKALGVQASRDMAGQIPNAALKLYPQWGHGLYEEAKDFLPTLMAFLGK